MLTKTPMPIFPFSLPQSITLHVIPLFVTSLTLLAQYGAHYCCCCRCYCLVVLFLLFVATKNAEKAITILKSRDILLFPRARLSIKKSWALQWPKVKKSRYMYDLFLSSHSREPCLFCFFFLPLCYRCSSFKYILIL